jgi:modulator of FtsH protease
MNEYIRPGYARASTLAEAGAEKVAFLRKVYGYFTGSIVFAALGAMIALYAGAGVSRAQVDGHTVPPLVLFFAQHWIIGMLMFLGSFMGASMVRTRPGLNVLALFGAAFVSGLYIAPMIWFVSLQATGTMLSPSPVRDAFLLAAMGFTGLSAYALLSRRDFSFLGGFLSMGLWVLIGASVLGMFVGGSAFPLAIASVGVLLFGAYILYDTSRILRDPDNRDAVGAAISLYLSFLNLFLFLLRILSSSRRDA